MALSPLPPSPPRLWALRIALAALFVLGSLAPLAAQDPGPIMPPPSMVGPHKAEPPHAKQPATPPVPAEPVRITPRTWRFSTYSFEGRVETSVVDVVAEVPDAYKESFAFWTNRMKDTSRTELIQYLTTTREPDKDGTLPFRRQVARFLVDMLDHGEAKAAGGEFTKAVQSLSWSGAFDPQGRVTGLTRVGGPEDMSQVDRLTFPLLDVLFPALDGERTMKPGDTFTDEVQMPLPSKLSIAGLSKTEARLTRHYTLQQVAGQEAIFDVVVEYATDPSTPPTAARTTCVISGGGKGKATFDLKDGIFVRAEQSTHLVIDLEAPLRHLPDQPPDFDPGTGKSHLDVVVKLSGTQKVAQLFQTAPPADAAPAAGTDPQPGTPPTSEPGPQGGGRR